MREYTPDNILKLNENEVFVFGSNRSGFHGAGAAGLACRGDFKNNWRNDVWFNNALKLPIGHAGRIGKWAVVGISKGFQIGRFGKSYAIVTVQKPGQRRSISLREIEEQIFELNEFAKKNNNLKFFVTKIGCSLAGYSESEIKTCFENIKDLSDNIILPREFEFRP